MINQIENYPLITKEKSKKYLFCWTEITKKDSTKFAKFLRNFGINSDTAKIEKINNGRTIQISSEKNHLSFSLNNERTKATLKIDDSRTYEFIVKMENGKLNVYPKLKVNELIDRWILPINKYNLKIWIHSTNGAYSFPSIGIGLGTIFKPNIFTFAVLDENSVQWFESVLKESIDIYDKNKKSKHNAAERLILWEKKKELDKLRKISIALSVIKKMDSASINLMVNSSSAFLFTDLYPDDVDWILTTLSIAKNKLEILS